MNLEQLVRPFSAVDLLPSRLPTPPRGGEDTQVDCSFGGSGTRTVSWSFDGAGIVQKETKEDFKEVGRESKQARVENPDDPDQFVEFCQATKVNLHRDKKSVAPPRLTSYDPTGGYHGNSSSPVTDRDYGFNYDKSNTTCKPAKPPAGCA